MLVDLKSGINPKVLALETEGMALPLTKMGKIMKGAYFGGVVG